MLLFFTSVAHSWWGEPHYFIARLAESMLSASEVKYLNRVLATWESEKAVFHDTGNWHDDLKPIGMPLMVPWHFRNQPVVDPNYNLVTYPVTYNVTQVNKDCLSAIYDTSTTSMWILGFCFRSLAHFVADAHCPVHASCYFSADYPNGDGGATKEKFVCPVDEVCDKLHFVWDSGSLNFQTWPIPESLVKEAEYNLSHLWTNYPPEKHYSSTYNSIDPDQWQSDAYDVAKEYVYGLYQFGHNVTGEYFNKTQPPAAKLISVAAYRLGKVLQTFFHKRGFHLPGERSHITEILAWVIDSILIIIATIYSILILRTTKRSTAFSPLREP
ncbi:hypothetical protein TVAG_114410 [Trichomonas vaginalis G3]|uniref:Uncharacterized protein n=1 Tax=Trichomonas vaginalis (strain ATCC PRA-98 / G3) TaxID=412133 RepID=A2FAR0_TRIV3|nr:S1-P1 nuclease family [Trichomonas vaginalis G3]EAX97989.1 hypothetical protein TVAG_114410 [Trichomonas vaginalis G3]KAI5521903.1 S1-P1 nuclease family [Trichomonas vaginalis G3]|eukprot:XP_001310919.1 hypothetical protein [Trichomonas vaginalis G3]